MDAEIFCLQVLSSLEWTDVPTSCSKDLRSWGIHFSFLFFYSNQTVTRKLWSQGSFSQLFCLLPNSLSAFASGHITIFMTSLKARYSDLIGKTGLFAAHRSYSYWMLTGSCPRSSVDVLILVGLNYIEWDAWLSSCLGEPVGSEERNSIKAPGGSNIQLCINELVSGHVEKVMWIIRLHLEKSQNFR